VAAVAAHHRRDAMEARRSPERLEGELWVVVRVGVDDARHHDEAVGVEHAPGAREPADVGDDPVPDADVGEPPGQARAVHHRPGLADRVEVHAVYRLYWVSLWAGGAHARPSRPTPERLYPPKGASGCIPLALFTCTVPVRSARATRVPRARSRVQTYA